MLLQALFLFSPESFSFSNLFSSPISHPHLLKKLSHMSFSHQSFRHPLFISFFPVSLILPKKRNFSSVFLASLFLLSYLFLALQASIHPTVSSFPCKLLPTPLLLVQGRCHHFQPPLWQVTSLPHVHAGCSWKLSPTANEKFSSPTPPAW